MSKINKILLTVLLLPLLIVNVYASSAPYQWIVDGEKVNGDQSNSAGTARVVKDGKVMTLFLKSYNGGKLELDCYGTGQSDMQFIINLEGESTITAEDVGIKTNEGESVKFEGNGKLTINAPKPISYESDENQKIIDLSAKEEVAETTGETTQSSDDNKLVSENNDDKKLIAEKDDDKKELISNKEDNNDWLVRILGGLVLVSIAAIAFLVVKLNQKNKKETQN